LNYILKELKQWQVGFWFCGLLLILSLATILFSGNPQSFADTTDSQRIITGKLSQTVINLASNEKVNLSFSLSGSYNVWIYVIDSKAQPVKRIYRSGVPLSNGTHSGYNWDGKQENGAKVSPGSYRIYFIARPLIGKFYSQSSHLINVTDNPIPQPIDPEPNPKPSPNPTPTPNPTPDMPPIYIDSDVPADPIEPVIDANNTPEPVAKINLASKQQIGYPVSMTATTSKGVNRKGEYDRFGIKKFKWEITGPNYTKTFESSYYAHIAPIMPSKTEETYRVKLTVTDYANRTAIAEKDFTSTNFQVLNIPQKDYADICKTITEQYVWPNKTNIPTIYKLPKGVYQCSRIIEVKDNAIFEGQGTDETTGTVLRKASGNDATFVIFGANTRITNLRLKGWRLSYTTNEGKTIAEGPDRPLAFYAKVNNIAHNIYVDHIEIDGCGEANRSYGKNTFVFDKNVVHNCDSDGSGYGAQAGGGDYMIIKNSKYYNNRHSIVAAGTTGSCTKDQQAQIKADFTNKTPGNIHCTGAPYWAANTGYDVINNTFTISDKGDVSTADAVIDSHMSARGRLRITGNTFDKVYSAFGIHEGWGEVRLNTFKDIRIKNTISAVLYFGPSNHRPYGFDIYCDGKNPGGYLYFDMKDAESSRTGCEVFKGANNFRLEKNDFQLPKFSYTPQAGPTHYYLIQTDKFSSIKDKKFFIDGCQVIGETKEVEMSKGRITKWTDWYFGDGKTADYNTLSFPASSSQKLQAGSLMCN